MVLIFYAALNVIALYFFIKYRRKKLHSLEILIYWCGASYLFQNYSALCYMNFKTLIIPEELSLEFAHVINRIILFPLIMVTFLNYYIFLSSNLKRLVLLISFILLLAGLEGLSHILHVIIHVNWKVWWSFTFWTAILLFLIGFAKVFRILLFKGGLKI